MAIYRYVNKDQTQAIEASFPIGTAPRRIVRSDRVYRLDITACSRNRAPQSCALWPIVSDAAAIHPDQIPEAREYDRQHGVPTEYTRDGQPVFTDRAHRKAYCEAHGLYDRNGGYGDPQRRGASYHDLPELPRRRS